MGKYKDTKKNLPYLITALSTKNVLFENLIPLTVIHDYKGINKIIVWHDKVKKFWLQLIQYD